MLRRTLLALVGLALSAATAACGGGAKPVAAAATTTTSTTPRQAYNACLRDHGVNLPERTTTTGPAGAAPTSQDSRPPRTRPADTGAAGTDSSRPPGTGFRGTLPPGVDQAKFDAARQACASLLPADNGQGLGAQGGQAFQVYASCLRDHGVTLNGPGNGGPGGFAGVNRGDPTFQAADAICAPLRPTTTEVTKP